MKKQRTRDRSEIIAQILRSIQGEPVTRTKIMYGCMINYVQVVEMIRVLIDAGLAVTTTYGRYGITEKGRIYLALHDEANRLLVPDIKVESSYS